jgi:hypothetical protein
VEEAKAEKGVGKLGMHVSPAPSTVSGTGKVPPVFERWWLIVSTHIQACFQSWELEKLTMP